MEPLAYAGHLYDLSRRYPGKALELRPASHLRQALFQEPAVRPGLQLGLGQFPAVPHLVRAAANDVRQGPRRQVAALRFRRLFGLSFQHVLIGRIPTARDDPFALPARIYLGIEFQQGVAVFHRKHRLVS